MHGLYISHPIVFFWCYLTQTNNILYCSTVILGKADSCYTCNVTLLIYTVLRYYVLVILQAKNSSIVDSFFCHFTSIPGQIIKSARSAGGRRSAEWRVGQAEGAIIVYCILYTEQCSRKASQLERNISKKIYINLKTF